MKLIKANLHNLNATQVAAKADYVVSKMSGNASFPTPTPTMLVLTAAISKLRDFIASANSGAHEAIADRDLQAGVVRKLMATLVEYVNLTSGSDLVMALSSGFEQVRKPEPAILGTPENVRSKPSAYKGCVDTGWDRVPGARMYQVEMCEGDPDKGTWAAVGTSSRASLRAKGLVSGGLYSFRVKALGAAGEGPVSEIVTSRAA